MRFLRLCRVWWPTRLGWLSIILLSVLPPVWWLEFGELFLSATNRVPRDVLVVEGWIGRDGVRAAANEFKSGGYRYVVAAGGTSPENGWEEGGWSYAERAKEELLRLGISESKVVFAPAADTENHRTFQSAAAVWRTLEARSIHPNALTVFTLGPHARRSLLVFEKIYQGKVPVGVIGWIPSDYKSEPWWRSSERARELIAETSGYLYERLLNSGRASNSPIRDGHEQFSQVQSFFQIAPESLYSLRPSFLENIRKRGFLISDPCGLSNY